MDIEAKTKKYYSRCKERSFSHPVIQEFSKPKLEWIMSKTNLTNKKVLEVGAGNGYFSNLLINICDLTVIDTSEYQLKLNSAEKKYLGSVYELPFKKNSFDIVFCSNLLHHLNKPQDAIDEMKRVAKDKVIILEPNRNNPILFIGALFIGHERGAIKSSKKYITKMIKKSGMKIKEHTYIGGLVMPHGTPTIILPLSGAKSKNRLSFFQIFICEKIYAKNYQNFLN